jgi:hypothetical protein
MPPVAGNNFSPVIQHLNNLKDLLDTLSAKLGGVGTEKPTVVVPGNNAKAATDAAKAATVAALVAEHANATAGNRNAANQGANAAAAAKAAAAAALVAEHVNATVGNRNAANQGANAAAAAAAAKVATTAALVAEHANSTDGNRNAANEGANAAAAKATADSNIGNGMQHINVNVLHNNGGLGKTVAARKATMEQIAQPGHMGANSLPASKPGINKVEKNRNAKLNNLTKNVKKSNINSVHPEASNDNKKKLDLEQGKNGFVATQKAKLNTKKGGRRIRKRHTRRRRTTHRR